MAYSMPLWTIFAKWPAPTFAGVHGAELTFGLEGVEDRLDPCHVVLRAAVHERVAVLEAPHAAGDTAVDEADALGRQLRGVLLVVGPAGVAAVDHDVADREQLRELVDGGLRRRTRRDHHPHDAGGLQAVHKFPQAVDIGEVRVAVVSDDGVACAADALAHVAAHLAETDETKLHQVVP